MLLSRRALTLNEEPAQVFARAAHLEGAVFLDSSLNGDSGALSVIAFAPDAIARGRVHVPGALREWLDSHRAAPSPDRGFPEGGAIGYLTYEGESVFGLYTRMLIYQHRTETWWDVGGLAEQLPDRAPSLAAPNPVEFRAGIDRETYCERVRRAQEYIAAGDIYQVNLAQEFTASWTPGQSAYPLYEALRNVSPAPYAPFLKLGGRQVLPSSPEQFLHISGREIQTRPIKGTRPRFLDPDQDERSRYDLITSDKEVAELIMITDLERNDLGRICEFGSVHASELLKLESFQHVFHLVSTVRGTLRPEVTHLEALGACFPGGSITGAPKKRAMEIIKELETAPRGVYTGAIGYLGLNGESQFNIAIRTAVIEGDRLSYHAGSGIVADSVPEKEYEETMHKAAGVFHAANLMGKR